MVAAVLKGSIPGGQAYGYDLVRKFDETGEPIRGLRNINPHQADIVRRIFREYTEKKSLKAICADLNFEGEPAPKGGKWVSTTLIGQLARKTGLLRQTLYKGEVTFNRMLYRKHPETGRRLSHLRPEKDWIRVPAPELAIFDEDYFDGVQKMIEERSTLRKERALLNQILTLEEKAQRERVRARAARARQVKERRHATQIMSRKLRCAEHDVLVSPVRHHLYNCAHRPCLNRNVKYAELMPLILEQLRLFDAAALKRFYRSQKKNRAALASKRKAYERRLTRERTEIQSILEALGHRRRSEDVGAYLTDREKSIRRLRHDIGRLDKKMDVITEPSAGADERTAEEFQRAIKPLFAPDFDQDAVVAVRPYIARIYISAQSFENSKIVLRRVKIEYDFVKIIEAFRK
ncbi:recombinase family protein [Varunaivibrio sulfuroxidans]|uniref:Recombinase n=1 Tax=Varunaivibrio sulfuroxidans TaxID=1773489 RepID=A0A4R3J567_9PROT|nr:recombinase family protein [Varunaivibrio sulfuroxidans]TCS59956.1 recombinase [Varunaivibrio sulfuroxidans]WES31760.1 recombinase family protein [Varunaivibrio sulfuroxidans]